MVNLYLEKIGNDEREWNWPKTVFTKLAWHVS